MPERGVGFGGIVELDHDSDATYEAQTQVIDIDPPSLSAEDVDVTTIDDNVEQTVQSKQINAGELSFTQLYDPNDTEQAKLDTLLSSGAAVPWRISYPFATPDVQGFTGYVKGLEIGTLAVANAITRKCTVKLTSLPS